MKRGDRVELRVYLGLNGRTVWLPGGVFVKPFYDVREPTALSVEYDGVAVVVAARDVRMGSARAIE